MLSEIAENLPVYLITGYTDMRKSIDGLAMIIQSNHHLIRLTNHCSCFVVNVATELKVFYGKVMVF
ncbi:MAG: IS66 family insertion sequence element accessory protein TnpB [Oscillospiraceae bacterium]|nr:IS66 family insertion sequence element accessory protein TnpB [Oscillospiraceae bacterium]